MQNAHGIGLSAPQIGLSINLFIIDLSPYAEDDPSFLNMKEVFINPEIIKGTGSIVWEEGCLSVPGFTDKVKRKESITIRAFNRHGEEFTLDVSQLYSVAIQHEMDHLEGKVFVDYLSRLKRDVVKRKMNRLKINGTTDGVQAASQL